MSDSQPHAPQKGTERMERETTNPSDPHQPDDDAALHWLAARNLLGPDAAGQGVPEYLELIDSHARAVLEARA